MAPKDDAVFQTPFLAKVLDLAVIQTHFRARVLDLEECKRTAKTYNRRDSQMVTHSSTSRPVQCLCMAERTGCPVFTDLWSYVLLTNCLNL